MKDRLGWAFMAGGVLVYQLYLGDALFADYVGGYRFVRLMAAGLFGVTAGVVGVVVAELIEWSSRP